MLCQFRGWPKRIFEVYTVTEASCDYQRNLKIIQAVFVVKWSRAEKWDYIEWAVLPGRCSTLWGSPSPARISLMLLPQQSLPCLSWRAGWSYTGCLASGCLHIFATFLLQKHTVHVGGCRSPRSYGWYLRMWYISWRRKTSVLYKYSSYELDMTRADKYYKKTSEKQVSVSYFYAGGKNICVRVHVCACVSPGKQRRFPEASRERSLF